MRLSSLLCGLGLGLASLAAWPTAASASPVFPGAILEAANMPCVPTCLLCHTTNPGTATSWPGNSFGLAMDKAGAQAGDEDSLKAAYATWAADANNAAGVKRLSEGQHPTTGVDVCGPTYGCGATIAAHTRARRTNPESAVAAALAVLAGLLVMRRGRRR